MNATSHTPPSAMRGRVSVRSVGKIYDPGGAHVIALENCSIEFAPGEFVAVVGPSGCGKSTLLNIVAGFDMPTSGEVYLDGTLLASETVMPRPGPDRVVVFQQGALFPWKTVLENVTYGLLKQRKVSAREAREQGLELLARSGGLDKVANAYPSSLSSGMQRRVEILRALINDPDILLLDEPFRAMDTVSKANMHRHLLDLFSSNPKTIMFITHDLEEALFLADRVLVMTTRPGTISMDIAVNLPRPRTREMKSSAEFIQLKSMAIAAVHEEARKAFERGEKEMA